MNMKTKVFVYCRRSSEGEDRQMLSIPSQKSELEKLLKINDLDVLNEPIEESKSAKVPGREKFNQMIRDLEEGKAKRFSLGMLIVYLVML